MDLALLAQAVVALLTQLLPTIESGAESATVDTIINTLINIIPVVAQWAEDLLPSLQNIVTALKGGTITAAQMTALEQAEQALDAAFEAQAAADGDPAPAADPGAAPASTS